MPPLSIYIFNFKEMDNNLKKIADRLKSVDKTAITADADDDDFGKRTSRKYFSPIFFQ